MSSSQRVIAMMKELAALLPSWREWKEGERERGGGGGGGRGGGQRKREGE